MQNFNLSWRLVFSTLGATLRCVVKILSQCENMFFLITTNKLDQLCFTFLKSFLINFSGLISRYCPLLFAMNKRYSLMISFLTFSSKSLGSLSKCGISSLTVWTFVILLKAKWLENLCWSRIAAQDPYRDRNGWRIKEFSIFYLEFELTHLVEIFPGYFAFRFCTLILGDDIMWRARWSLASKFFNLGRPLIVLVA